MKKRLLILILTIVLVLGITACGGSNTNTENAGNTISDAMPEEMGEVTPAPTEEPAPTPEPTATPEPTLAPIEWTTEEGTLLPTEPVVFIKGSAVKLPCTVEEFKARTGEKIFKSDVEEGDTSNHRAVYFPTYRMMLTVPKDAESFEDYIIYSISVNYTELYEDVSTDVTLPGDIYIGLACTSWDDLTVVYGLSDCPDPEGAWWNIGDDNPGFTFDYVTCATTHEEHEALSRGYCVGFDDYRQVVTNIEVNVSSDKLYELYGVR